MEAWRTYDGARPGVNIPTLKSSEGNILIMWSGNEKEMPPYPGPPEAFPEDDERHWFDLEYAGWDIGRVGGLVSLGDGSTRKRVVYIGPGVTAYQSDFCEHLSRAASGGGVELSIVSADWDPLRQAQLVTATITTKPDLVIINPENMADSALLFALASKARIPIVACNFSRTPIPSPTSSHGSVPMIGDRRAFSPVILLRR